jgi:hypothetical protein
MLSSVHISAVSVAKESQNKKHKEDFLRIAE